MKEKGSYCGECMEKLGESLICPLCGKDFPTSPELEDAVKRVAFYKFEKRI